MILEYQLDFRSNHRIYEKYFVKLLDKYNLEGKVLREGFISKLYVEINETQNFNNFLQEFSENIPHSIFLYNVKTEVIPEFPETKERINFSFEKKEILPFCLNCLKTVFNKDSEDYYNIFTQCDICGYNISGDNRNYQKDFENIAKIIADNKKIKITTFYGNYILGKLENSLNDINFDILAYDYATIATYTHAIDYELKALAAIEKPFIKLKTNIKFKTEIEELQNELIRFKLPDDFILQLLMTELNKLNINMVFLTKDNLEFDEFINFLTPIEQEPLEVVASPTNVLILKGNKSLPKTQNLNKSKIPSINAINSVIEEHNLTKKYKNFAGIYLSKKYKNIILVYGEKYGIKEYLLLEFKFNSITEILENIASSGESGKKLINNFKINYNDLYDKIKDIKFEKNIFNIYEVWGIFGIILGLANTTDIQEASKIMEKNTMLFLGDKAPRIDYKIVQRNGVTSIQIFKTLQTALSFKLAGIDDLSLSYGFIDSFVEFLSNELDDLKEYMNIEAVIVAGNLLENNKLFAKITREFSTNHKVYFNNIVPVELFQ